MEEKISKMKKIKIKCIIMVLFYLLIICYGNVFAAKMEKNLTVNYLKLGNTNYGGGYLYGEIVSEKKPNIVFKSADGTIKKDVYIEYRGKNTYYFDRHLVEIDNSKKYIFEINDNNQIYRLNLGSNRNIGIHIDYSVEVNNNEIEIKDYTPQIKLNKLNLGKTNYGGAYVYGELVSAQKPKIVFKSTDGKIIKDVYLEYKGNNIYYFDRHLIEIELEKQYVFEVTIGKSVQNINLGKNRNLGTIAKISASISNNTINVNEYKYIGNPYVKTKSIEIGTTQTGRKYIYGEIEYYEKEGGTLKTTTISPKIVFKSIDGLEEKEVYIRKIDEKTYYFDRHIIELDMNKQYIFEVTSGDKSNKTTEKTTITLGNHDFGINQNKYKILTQNNKVKFTLEKYLGDPKVELVEFKIGLTNYNNSYVYGKIKYKELVNGNLRNSTDLPKIVFKSIDEEKEYEVYIQKISDDIYYFDRHLGQIDFTKEYFFEVSSGDIRNSSEKKEKISFMNKVKKYENQQYIVDISNNTNLKIKKITYSGELYSKVKTIGISLTEWKTSYLHGTIDYKEYVNGKEKKVEFNPIIEFKSIDGQKTYEVYVQKRENDTYYFDRHLIDFDNTKKYVFVIKSGDVRILANTKILDFSSENKKYSTYQYNVDINNNEFSFKAQSYSGTLNASITRIIANKNSWGYCLNGNIDCYEVVDGKKRNILFNPKIELVATDNSVSYNCYVDKPASNNRI